MAGRAAAADGDRRTEADAVRRRSTRRGQGPTLSEDRVVGTAIAMLDERGEAGLTLRGLATALGSGLASVYWYVDGRDQLVGLALDTVLGEALSTAGDRGPGEPLERVRTLLAGVFDVMRAHPWAALELMRRGTLRGAGLECWELVGRELAELGLDPERQFSASTALMSFVGGIGAQNAYQERIAGVGDGGDQSERLADFADRWVEGLDGERFPFVRSMAPVFADHDDREQFLDGLDLLLSGIALRAPTRPDRD